MAAAAAIIVEGGLDGMTSVGGGLVELRVMVLLALALSVVVGRRFRGIAVVDSTEIGVGAPVLMGSLVAGVVPLRSPCKSNSPWNRLKKQQSHI